MPRTRRRERRKCRTEAKIFKGILRRIDDDYSPKYTTQSRVCVANWVQTQRVMMWLGSVKLRRGSLAP